MTLVTRDGQLSGLAAMIADLVEANLISNPDRSRLLEGRPRLVRISASDLDAHLSLELGGGVARVSSAVSPRPHLWILADSATLLDLPNAKLVGGLPSIGDRSGRTVVRKILRGDLKVRGMFRVSLLSRVQRLLSVA